MRDKQNPTHMWVCSVEKSVFCFLHVYIHITWISRSPQPWLSCDAHRIWHVPYQIPLLVHRCSFGWYFHHATPPSSFSQCSQFCEECAHVSCDLKFFVVVPTITLGDIFGGRHIYLLLLAQKFQPVNYYWNFDGFGPIYGNFCRPIVSAAVLILNSANSFA